MSSSDQAFYWLGVSTSPGWEQHIGLALSTPLGGALTDARFPLQRPFPRDASWDPDWMGLSYRRDKVLPRIDVGQYLPPQQVLKWRAPVLVELYGERRGMRSFPSRTLEAHFLNHLACVSGRARDIIERIEPGRHQFIPVKFQTWDTGEELYPDQDMQILNILNWIAPDQFYDFKAMPQGYHEMGQEECGEPFIYRIAPSYLRDFRIRPEWLGTGHLFRTGDYSPRPGVYWHSPPAVYASEELNVALVEGLPAGTVNSVRIPTTEPSIHWSNILKKRADARTT
jgi:hypothetical protein